MTLDEFIATKPTSVRLGQWFVVCYCKPVDSYWDNYVNKLWDCNDAFAKSQIKFLLYYWQWDTLPPIPEHLLKEAK